MKKLYKNSEKCCVEMSSEELDLLSVIIEEFYNIYSKIRMNKYPDHEKQIKELSDTINKIYKDKIEDDTFCSCPKCGQNFKFNELAIFHPTCGYLNK